MFRTEAARKRLRNIAIVGAAAVAVVTVAATPALAYTQTTTGTTVSYPYMTYWKNSASPLNSQLTVYISVGGKRYEIDMRAGSGNGSTSTGSGGGENECATNEGWLPNGDYNNNNATTGDAELVFENKTWGNTVIRGYVWSLGSKKGVGCASPRTELFIHSEHTSGWNDSNYASEGCIKINQTDRGHLASMWQSAYDTHDADLYVY